MESFLKIILAFDLYGVIQTLPASCVVSGSVSVVDTNLHMNSEISYTKVNDVHSL